MIIWSTDGGAASHWQPQVLHRFNDVVWHVSWSITGGILAVSGGDNKVIIININIISYLLSLHIKFRSHTVAIIIL